MFKTLLLFLTVSIDFFSTPHARIYDLLKVPLNISEFVLRNISTSITSSSDFHGIFTAGVGESSRVESKV